MNPEILKRYDLTVDNKFIVPVSLPNYRALYEKYDYISSFYKRDLNQELVEYLFYCSRELGRRNDFVIRIDLPVPEKSEPDENDIILSIKKYFKYEISLCRHEIKSAFTRLILHFAIAAAAFLMWLILLATIPTNSTAVYQFIGVGLPVGIWVLLLMGVSRFLFRYQNQTTIIRLCKKISTSPVAFNYINGN